jgi:hypothetical protein
MTAMVLLSAWMESQVEFWLPIPNHDRYDVSSFGRVRSWRIVRPLSNRGGTVSVRRDVPRILKPHMTKDGYYVIGLDRELRGNRGKHPRVHRLVALAFLPNLDNLPTVNHITGLKSDNRVGALEWSSHADNSKHAWAHGLQKRDRQAFAKKMVEARRSSRLVPDVLVRMIRKMLADGISQGQIRRWSGLKSLTIQSISVGRTYRDVA